jgi:hypothetical protein
MPNEIQSISQGTFTIGQTSATTYQAGPGISITQPSEGTVRISNDETVLWSGTYNGSVGSANAITLSEPYTNFDRVQFEMGGVYHSIWTYNSIATQFQVTSPFVSTDGSTTLYAVMYNSINGNKIYRNGCGILNNAALTNNKWVNNSAGTQGECTLVKIIGINRISGGNA